MNQWKTPKMEKFSTKQLSQIIRAKAWSASPEVQLGMFLDQANVGMRGMVHADFNPGHAIQVEVIGRVFTAGYLVVTFITSDGNTYTYRRPEGGGFWERSY